MCKRVVDRISRDQCAEVEGSSQQIDSYLVAAVVAILWFAMATGWLNIPLYFAVSAYAPQETYLYQGILVDDAVTAVALPLLGTVVAAAGVLTVPAALAAGQVHIASRLLGPSAEHRMRRRIEHLTRTRSDTVEARVDELRRIERDLHDGVQARLTSAAIRLGLLEQALAGDPVPLGLATDAREATEDALAELRAIVRTVSPPVLTERGLVGAVSQLAAQNPLRVRLDADPLPALPETVANAAYFVVAEALNNAARHSGGVSADVELRADDRRLAITVTDAGHGGVDRGRGTGLGGLERRLAALDGELEISSPAGGPTTVRATLPVDSDATAEASRAGI